MVPNGGTSCLSYTGIHCINIRQIFQNIIRKGVVRQNSHMKFINIGFGNMVAAHRVVTIVNLDSSPIKRMVQDAKEEGRVIDVTCGRRTRSVIVTDSEHIILSAVQTETIAGRLDNDDSDLDTAEDF